ncbi:MAG: hypothetical protein IPK94_08875 [Saprospiraceae bacterium]|nr:hypothetical protein [Saprospiraceae bacterium]
MKKLFVILGIELCCLGIAFGQVIPKGMTYKAVARKDKRVVIADETVDVKIVLFSIEDNQRVDYYSESHVSQTSHQGLFDLVIGEGIGSQGQFGLVPWNEENIWLEVSIRDNANGALHTISNSRLMAVPYAMHSVTADKIVETNSVTPSSFAPPEPGVISTEWSLLGNAKTDASGNIYRINSLGTSDFVDVIMITDNVERLRILPGGDIVTKLNFDIGQNLKVGENLNVGLNATIGDSLIIKKNVLLNILGGSTINCGPFTVANYSPTLLTGSLSVDKNTELNTTLNVDKSSNLNGYLFVNKKSNTKMTGTLQVDSVTNLNSALYVNNMSPSLLSGTLRVAKEASFLEKLKILSMYSTDTSGIMPTGSLQVGGGAYIKENLYIGGIAKFGGPVAFAGAVSIFDLTQSTTPNTGALKVSGGVGIGLNLNVGGMTMSGGMTTIKDLTESSSYSTGALKILGGMGIKRRLNVAGITSFSNTLSVAGVSVLSNSLHVANPNSFIATFTNTTNQNGLSIQINNPAPGWANNFVEFRNGSSSVVGRIEGENSGQFMSNQRYINELAIYDDAVLRAQLNVASAAVFLASATAGVIAAAASSTACVGFGVCVTTPIISYIVFAAIEAAARVGAIVASAYGLTVANDKRSEFITFKTMRAGVTYESGAGDYAEWLPKYDTLETFAPGQIVGVKNGMISKQIHNDSKILVISTKPIVLGNTPDVEQKRHYEKVAFLGQVPVYVWGKANAGDYILPSGGDDGLARAVPKDEMKAEDYQHIIGVAWSSSEYSTCNLINVAIGLHSSDITREVVKQDRLIKELEEEFKQSNIQLAMAVPGYKEAAGINSEELASQIVTSTSSVSPSSSLGFGSLTGILNSVNISDEQIKAMMKLAEKSIIDNGGSLSDNPFWSRLNSDDSYQGDFIKSIQNTYKKEFQTQMERVKSRQ